MAFGLPSPRLATLRVGVLLLALTCIEAFVLLQVFGMGLTPLSLYDYRVYNQLGVNILERGTFAADEAPPYHPTIFRPPGYPAFIALVYLAAGQSLLALRIAQFFLAWLTAWILYEVGTHYTSRKGALAAAVLCATYPSFVFWAPLFAAHSLCLFLMVLTTWVLVTLDDGSRWRWLHYGFLGVCIGVMALVRPAFQLLPAFFAAGLVIGQPREAARRRLGPIAVLVLCVGLVVVPWIVRNNRISGGSSGTSIMVGGWSLYHSVQQYSGEFSYRTPIDVWDRSIGHFNRRSVEADKAIPDSDPYAVPRREILTSHLLTEDAVRIARGLTVPQVLASLPSRLYWLWSTSDVSPWQTGEFAFHRFAQAYHALIVGLILVGCYSARHSLIRLWPLWVLAVYQTLLHLVFHVEPRFTLEGRLLLLVFAGMGVDHLAAQFRGRPAATAAAKGMTR
jgi:4-amino-4-deoxy-L-arabinose transferase-like glycosyltransferase